jgi:acylphosphatase
MNEFWASNQYNIASCPCVWLSVAVPQKPTERCRMEVYYSGHVQGVGFRYTVKSTAAGFEITGTVRNLTDGRVELIAEGVRDELEAFRTAIRDAGVRQLIHDEAVTWGPVQNTFRGFEIVR